MPWIPHVSSGGARSHSACFLFHLTQFAHFPSVSTCSGEHRLRVRSTARRWLFWCSARARGQRTNGSTKNQQQRRRLFSTLEGGTLWRYCVPAWCCFGCARHRLRLLFSGVTMTPGSPGMRDVSTRRTKQTQLISPLCVELGAREYKFSTRAGK